MSDLIKLEADGPIRILTINQPETRNAISDPEMVDAVADGLATLNADKAVRVIILTGAGKAFSAGGNLKKMGQPGELGGGEPIEIRRGYREGIQKIPLTFQALEVPVIAAVNGPAIGAGCDLACMCDIRIAGESALFAESFVKLGLIPGDGGAWLLQRVVGFSKAAEMSFTGEGIGAAEALACGLVSKVVPDAELMTAARELARRIAANPSHAVRMTKRLMVEARHARLDTVLELSAAMQALAHSTADYREAMDAFRERRPPKFRE
jgi:enoyl-CoA hydratase/carnithine racemase